MRSKSKQHLSLELLIVDPVPESRAAKDIEWRARMRGYFECRSFRGRLIIIRVLIRTPSQVHASFGAGYVPIDDNFRGCLAWSDRIPGYFELREKAARDENRVKSWVNRDKRPHPRFTCIDLGKAYFYFFNLILCSVLVFILMSMYRMRFKCLNHDFGKRFRYLFRRLTLPDYREYAIQTSLQTLEASHG